MKANSGGLLAVVMVVAAALASTASAVDYKVDGSQGWDTYVDYDKWVAGKTFMVGDTIRFKYQPYHNVLEVTEADYGSCAVGSPLSTHSGGDTTFELTEAGTRYFICGIPRHCTDGTMHVKIATVPYDAATAASLSAAAAASPSPAPLSSPTAQGPAAADTVADAKNPPASSPTTSAHSSAHSSTHSSQHQLQSAAAVAGLALAALVALVA